MIAMMMSDDDDDNGNNNSNRLGSERTNLRQGV